VQSVLALPLGADPVRLGALNLYGPKIDAFSDRHVALLRVLTEQISRTVAEYATTLAATDLEAHLRQALVSRAPIEQAKGILMAVHHCTADEAFDRLRTQSQNTNTNTWPPHSSPPTPALPPPPRTTERGTHTPRDPPTQPVASTC
jgi:ANTAR domain